jgi:hypothetical protein
VQKRDLRIITRCTACVGPAFADPTFRHKFVGILAPELWAAIDCPRNEHDHRADWDGCASEGRGADTFPDGNRNTGIEAERFVADCVEERK